MDRLRSQVAVALGAAALLLSGCGGAPEAPGTPSPPAPAITVVTVPGLSSSATGPGGTSAGEGGDLPDASGAPGETPPGSPTTAPATAGTTTADESETGTVSSSQSVSPRTPIPPRQPGASPLPTAGTPPAAVPSTVAVDLASCAGCRVIGVAAEVRPGLAVALATAPQGAVLLATRADGAVVGVTNVPYGVTFPKPAGGRLPCDGSGRCFVTAAQSQGNSVISVFQLEMGGQWRDVTAAGGFTSATSTAAVLDIDGDGLLDIAVQADAARALRWVAYHWSGDRFVVLGCAAASGAAPDGAAVSLAGCS